MGVAVPETQYLQVETLGQLEGLAQVVGMEEEGPGWIRVRVATGVPGTDLAVRTQQETTGLLVASLVDRAQDATLDTRRDRERTQHLELGRRRAHFLLRFQL